MQDTRPTIAEALQRIEVLEEQLRQAQKLTALGELVSTTTHEFNNVLMTILNYAKLGIKHRDDTTRDKAFEKILGAGQRAAKITNGILGFARNRSNQMEPTDLARIVDDTLTLLERELQKYRVQVDTELRPVPPVNAIGNQLQQVLMNLVTNARQAMPGGGRLLVRLQHDTTTDWVELMVRDSGTGIPADKLPRIFDRFFSTKDGPDDSGKGGTGLGLAFCKDVIEAHQGRIRVESSVGVGTAFTLKFPAAQTVPQPAAQPMPQAASVPPARHKVPLSSLLNPPTTINGSDRLTGR